MSDRKYWATTTVFGDGGTFRHIQRGEVLVGETPESAKPTGITWEWRQCHDGREERSYEFDGVEYATSWEARIVYESLNP